MEIEEVKPEHPTKVYMGFVAKEEVEPEQKQTKPSAKKSAGKKSVPKKTTVVEQSPPK